MDYKEKYEQALERARVWKEKSGMPVDRQGILDNIFPELKESEDERIRNEIIDYLKSFIPHHDNDLVAKSKQWIAWLEKQGEQKPAWSKEDYDEIGVIACHLDNMGNEAMANSLLCIRGKYNNVKPKQEWSVEDEQRIESAIEHLENSISDTPSSLRPYVRKDIDWLKSLKERMKGK